MSCSRAWTIPVKVGRRLPSKDREVFRSGYRFVPCVGFHSSACSATNLNPKMQGQGGQKRYWNEFRLIRPVAMRVGMYVQLNVRCQGTVSVNFPCIASHEAVGMRVLRAYHNKKAARRVLPLVFHFT